MRLDICKCSSSSLLLHMSYIKLWVGDLRAYTLICSNKEAGLLLYVVGWMHDGSMRGEHSMHSHLGLGAPSRAISDTLGSDKLASISTRHNAARKNWPQSMEFPEPCQASVHGVLVVRAGHYLRIYRQIDAKGVQKRIQRNDKAHILQRPASTRAALVEGRAVTGCGTASAIQSSHLQTIGPCLLQAHTCEFEHLNLLLHGSALYIRSPADWFGSFLCRRARQGGYDRIRVSFIEML